MFEAQPAGLTTDIDFTNYFFFFLHKSTFNAIAKMTQVVAIYVS